VQLRQQLPLSKAIGLLDTPGFEAHLQPTDTIGRQLGGWIRSFGPR
jgi:hypothetical protein